MRYKISTKYVKEEDITRFMLYYGPSLSTIKIIDKKGNLLKLENDYEMNRVLHKLKEHSKYETT